MDSPGQQRPLGSAASTPNQIDQPRDEESAFDQPTSEDVQLHRSNTEPFPEIDLDKGIVGWDGQDDPANPQNFSQSKKISLLVLISAFTFVSPLASSMLAPAMSYLAEDLGVTDDKLLSFSVIIFLLGYVVSVLPAVLLHMT